jgi:hypothetical protein
MGGDEECVQILVRRLEGNRPLGRPRHKWRTVSVSEMECEVMDWIHGRLL